MKTKSAFSIAELFIVLVLLSIISTLVIYSMSSSFKKAEILSLKNAYTNFKTALIDILEDPLFYSQKDGLADLSTYKIGGENLDNSDCDEYNGGSCDYGKEYYGVSKFRELMFRQMEISTSTGTPCYLMKESRKGEMGTCYRADNGTVWGILDTNFKDEGVVEVENSLGQLSKYTPITIYPNSKKVTTLDGFENQAIIIGVRLDGSINILYSLNCEEEKNKDSNQCKLTEYLSK